MAGQYRTGKVSVTNGSATVVGSGVDWSAFSAINNPPYPLFVVKGVSTIYTVLQSELSAGVWTLTLTSAYNESTASSVDYAIVRDFTPYFNLPLMAAGDVETASMYSRAMTSIDQRLNLAGNNDPTWYNQTGHGFQIGTVVRLANDGASFVAADANTSANSNILGIVSDVVGSTFRLRQFGLITGLVKTLTPGSIYYLSDSPVADNLTSSPAIGLARIPVLIASGTHSGYALSMKAGDLREMVGATPTTPGVLGLVPPAPSGGGSLYLAGDGTWKSVAGSGITFGNLNTSPAFATPDWLGINSGMSVFNALLNLDRRLRSFQNIYLRAGIRHDYTYDSALNTPPALVSQSGVGNVIDVAVPPWATRAKISLSGPGGGGGGAELLYYSLSNQFLMPGGKGGTGGFAQFFLRVVPGSLLRFTLGQGGPGGTSFVGNFANASTSGSNGTADSKLEIDGALFVTAQKGLGGVRGSYGVSGTNGANGNAAPSGVSVPVNEFFYSTSSLGTGGAAGSGLLATGSPTNTAASVVNGGQGGDGGATIEFL